jgi:signal transduction histidine kinase
MPISLRTRQVAGVTAIVAVTVALLVLWYLTSLVRVMLDESQARADLVVNTVHQRVFALVAAADDPVEAIQADGGLRSILEASLFAEGVTYAAIVNADGIVIAHLDPSAIGQPLPEADELATLLALGPVARISALYARGGRMLEVRLPLLLGDTTEFGTIRVGLSTLLIRARLQEALRAPLMTALLALVAAVLMASLLAQLVVRPIHVIRSGLAKLGRGEVDVDVDLPAGGELGDLGDSFKAVTTRIAADRTELAGQKATLASLAGQLEDGVALLAPDGTVLFANPAMHEALGGAASGPLPADHPFRLLVDGALASPGSPDPVTVRLPNGDERAATATVVRGANDVPAGVLVVTRNLSYLSEVESMLSYSRKLSALSKLSAGVAHEIKNPLNATMIHLELLKMQVAGTPAAEEHVATISAQMRRLDEVVQGFLKFTRPEDLQLQPVSVEGLLDELLSTVRADADRTQIDVSVDCPADLPPVAADRAMLAQAFLNLALNACQAMPDGGRLRIVARPLAGRQVEVRFEDSGVGIAPDDLARVFDLYFTTKASGSGIGLSLVYRTIQLHDGHIEVQSTPGRGTTFRVVLRQAPPSVLLLSTS